MKIYKASLGAEDGRVCDICNRLIEDDHYFSIYYGVNGEKIDYCGRCLGGDDEDEV